VERSETVVWETPYLLLHCLGKGIRFAAVLSDGIESYQCRVGGETSTTFSGVGYETVVQELTAFKNFKGEFVYRRMQAFEKECAKRGWQHYDDVAVAALTFKNGAIGTLTATTAAYDGFPVRIDIYGTEGSAVIEGDRLKTLVLKNGEKYESEESAAHAIAVAKGGTASVKDEAATRLSVATGSAAADPGAVWGDAHRAQLEDFVQAIRNDTRPLIDGRAGRKPLEIITGVYQSARTGEPITLG